MEIIRVERRAGASSERRKCAKVSQRRVMRVVGVEGGANFSRLARRSVRKIWKWTVKRTTKSNTFHASAKYFTPYAVILITTSTKNKKVKSQGTHTESNKDSASVLATMAHATARSK